MCIRDSVNEHGERRLYAGLGLPRRQVEDLQVFLVGTCLRALPENVVGDAECGLREQVLTVAVVGEGPWLPHKPVYDVAVVDVVLTRPPEAWQSFDTPL